MKDFCSGFCESGALVVRYANLASFVRYAPKTRGNKSGQESSEAARRQYGTASARNAAARAVRIMRQTIFALLTRDFFMAVSFSFGTNSIPKAKSRENTHFFLT